MFRIATDRNNSKFSHSSVQLFFLAQFFFLNQKGVSEENTSGQTSNSRFQNFKLTFQTKPTGKTMILNWVNLNPVTLLHILNQKSGDNGYHQHKDIIEKIFT